MHLKSLAFAHRHNQCWHEWPDLNFQHSVNEDEDEEDDGATRHHCFQTEGIERVL